MSSRAGTRIAVFLIGLAVLVTTFASLGAQGEAGGTPRSVRSAADDGRRAMFLLLEELGLAPEVWSSRPGLLPREPALLWIARTDEDPKWKYESMFGDDADPEPDADGEPDEEPVVGAEGPAEPEWDPLVAAREAGLSSRAHYRAFLERGGTIVLEVGPDTEWFVREELGIAAVRGLGTEPVPSPPAPFDPEDAAEVESPEDLVRLTDQSEAERAAFDERVADLRAEERERAEAAGIEPVAAGLLGLLPDGELLALPGVDARLVLDLDAEVPRERFVETLSGEPLAASFGVGRGRLVLLATGDALNNDSIGERDHALLVVRTIEAYSPGGGVLVDEYALGLEDVDDVLDLAFGEDGWLLVLNGLLLALAWVLSAAWAREFHRDPEPGIERSPLARARGTARLFERAGRFDRLAAALQRGVWWRVARRARLGTGDGEEPTEPEVAAAARALGRVEEAERWRRVLCRSSVGTRGELAELDAHLKTIEAEAGIAALAGKEDR